MELIATSPSPTDLAQFVPRDITPPSEPIFIEPRGLFNARLRAPHPDAPWMRVGEYPIHRQAYLGLVLLALPVPLLAALTVVVALPTLWSGILWLPSWVEPGGALGILWLLTTLGGLTLIAALLPQIRSLRSAQLKRGAFLTVDACTLWGLLSFTAATLTVNISLLGALAAADSYSAVLVCFFLVVLFYFVGITLCSIGSIRQRTRRAKQPNPGVA